MTTAVAAPFRFFALSATRTRRLGPSLPRVTFTGPDPAGFHSPGRAPSLPPLLPHPGRREPALPCRSRARLGRCGSRPGTSPGSAAPAGGGRPSPAAGAAD